MTSIDNEKIEIELLLEAIYRKYGYDFRNYAKASIKRRILHRCAMSGLKTISELQHRMLYDVQFFETLLMDFSINVTEMFRDPSFYRALRESVLPKMRALPHLKLWHAGCATGEEVYSMAILLKEEGMFDNTQIYATDINENILKNAKEGIYPLERMKEYTYNYQKAGGNKSFGDYYTARYEYAVMSNSLRKNVVFADHNLVTDASFGEMDLIICRNVLIYFDRKLQDRALGLFSESLAAGGFLCLGSKESLRFSKHSRDFADAVADEKIYQKNNPMITRDFEAVAIGVSTGSWEALTCILPRLSKNFNKPMFIVYHVHKTSDDFLVHHLNKMSRLRVKQAEDKETIKPAVVYLAPPDYHLLIEWDYTIALSTSERVNYTRPSIDVMFETAADAYEDKLIGIVLTGANKDGSNGARKIKATGGLVIVQDPVTAEIDTMPRAAIAAADPHLILSLEEIADFLCNLK